jgi:hypothetical protein
LEDIINYNVIVRCLTEWTCTNQQGTFDQTSIAEGIGGVTFASDGTFSSNVRSLCNVRQKYIQGKSTTNPTTLSDDEGKGFGFVPRQGTAVAGTSGMTRRYQVNFALGLMTQDKLIPTKFMASQLAIEITLETPQACIFTPFKGASVVGTPTYTVTNVNLIPEILEFDASYDEMFLRGLREGGVPIKFCSWHTFTGTTSSGSNINMMIQERSRSVKAIFAVQRRAQPSFNTDSHATFFDTSNNGSSTLQNYQYRIGGRYFPASPVQCSTEVGSEFSNGGAEAFLELQKALNTVGDYRLSSSVNTLRWGMQNASGKLQEYDFADIFNSFNPTTGTPIFSTSEIRESCFAGDLGSQCFTMAINLETSNGVEISGLNAEEQSDISLIATWKLPQVTGVSNTPANLEVYSYYDAMIILRENNVLELIQ